MENGDRAAIDAILRRLSADTDDDSDDDDSDEWEMEGRYAGGDDEDNEDTALGAWRQNVVIPPSITVRPYCAALDEGLMLQLHSMAPLCDQLGEGGDRLRNVLEVSMTTCISPELRLLVRLCFCPCAVLPLRGLCVSRPKDFVGERAAVVWQEPSDRGEQETGWTVLSHSDSDDGQRRIDSAIFRKL
jgi:hypothetical protein